MKIIVAGDGKVGIAITRLLSQEGHDIVAIDTKANVLQQSGLNLDVMSVVGNCATMETLREAGVETTDVLIAATSADETNLLCCLTARKLNPTLHTIARVRNPEYTEQLFKMREDFGLSLIMNPEKDAAKEIYRLLQLPGFLRRETFAKRRVEIVELKIEKDSVLNGVQLSRLHYALGGKKVLVCAVIRDGEAFIPTADTVFRAGDHIYVTAPVAILSHILKKLGITQKRIKHAMLIGGGRVEALEFVMNERSRNIGVPLKKLRLKSKVLIACITHHGTNIVPDGNSTFEIGDTVIVITNREAPILQFNDIFA